MALTLRWNPAMCIEGNFNARLDAAEKSESYSSRGAPVDVLFPQAVRDLSLLVQCPASRGLQVGRSVELPRPPPSIPRRLRGRQRLDLRDGRFEAAVLPDFL